MEKKYNEETCCAESSDCGAESSDCCEEIEKRGQIREQLDHQEKTLYVLREKLSTLAKDLEPVSEQTSKDEAECANKESLVPIAGRIQNHNTQLSDLIDRIEEITGNLEI